MLSVKCRKDEQNLLAEIYQKQVHLPLDKWMIQFPAYSSKLLWVLPSKHREAEPSAEPLTLFFYESYPDAALFSHAVDASVHRHQIQT